jgi:hypothetical protein
VRRKDPEPPERIERFLRRPLLQKRGETGKNAGTEETFHLFGRGRKVLPRDGIASSGPQPFQRFLSSSIPDGRRQQGDRAFVPEPVVAGQDRNAPRERPLRFTEVREYRTRLDRRELILVAQQDQAGIPWHRRHEAGHHRQVDHRRLVHHDHVKGKGIFGIVADSTAESRAEQPVDRGRLPGDPVPDPLVDVEGGRVL